MLGYTRTPPHPHPHPTPRQTDLFLDVSGHCWLASPPLWRPGSLPSKPLVISGENSLKAGQSLGRNEPVPGLRRGIHTPGVVSRVPASERRSPSGVAVTVDRPGRHPTQQSLETCARAHVCVCSWGQRPQFLNAGVILSPVLHRKIRCWGKVATGAKGGCD